MEWWFLLIFIFGCLLILFATGMPMAFCFLTISLTGAYMFMGGEAGIRQVGFAIIKNLANFSLLPVFMFILLGEVMFLSGSAPRMIDILSKWLGPVPGRLSLLSVAAGTLFATMSGSSMAGVALLGSTLLPEMEKRGYKKSMSIGPIMGSGGLAMMIPPSALAVFVCAVGEISVGKVLLAITVPGFVMAGFYAGYIILRCAIQPSLAPDYEISRTSLLEKFKLTLKYVLPLGSIILVTLGFIFAGVATPSEAAALGAFASFVLAAIYKRLTWKMVIESVGNTVRITVMMLSIFAGAIVFSQILAFAGITRSLVQWATSFQLHPILLVACMQGIGLILGCFMEVGSIIMICFPVFMPLIRAAGMDTVWFAALMILNMETAMATPPFGADIFVMQGVAPPGTTLEEIYKSTLPFICMNILVLALILFFPGIALWLPSLMK